MEWYYALNDERRGPVADAEFQVLVSNGTIRPGTLVWRQGMADWAAFSSLSGGATNFAGEIGMRYAGFWIRFVAKFIDNIILSIIGFVIGIVGELTRSMSAPTVEVEAFFMAGMYGILLVINVLYYALFVGAYGATPGKMALSLRVVRSDAGGVSYPRAFGRYFAAALNYFTLGVGWFMAGWNDQKCALHDYICDTRVIHTD